MNLISLPRTFTLLSLFSIILISCQSEESTQNKTEAASIIGIWEVHKVLLGDEDFSPMGRWVQFNADSTQVSGNGWKRHSEGTWSQNDNTLNIVNTNGFIDPYSNFEFVLNGDSMVWKRTEEDQQVTIQLQRVKDIPKTSADELLGLWDLDSAFSGITKLDSLYDPENMRYLFLRWNNRFRDQMNGSQALTGTYQLNEHTQTMLLVIQKEVPELFEFNYSIDNNRLILNQTDVEEHKALHLHYHRIHEFPDLKE